MRGPPPYRGPASFSIISTPSACRPITDPSLTKAHAARASSPTRWLRHPPAGQDRARSGRLRAIAMKDALTPTMTTMSAELLRSLTWDRSEDLSARAVRGRHRHAPPSRCCNHRLSPVSTPRSTSAAPSERPRCWCRWAASATGHTPMALTDSPFVAVRPGLQRSTWTRPGLVVDGRRPAPERRCPMTPPARVGRPPLRVTFVGRWPPPPRCADRLLPCVRDAPTDARADASIDRSRYITATC